MFHSEISHARSDFEKKNESSAVLNLRKSFKNFHFSVLCFKVC